MPKRPPAPPPEAKALGKRIRQLRTDRSKPLTQEQVAEKADMDRAYYAGVEVGIALAQSNRVRIAAGEGNSIVQMKGDTAIVFVDGIFATFVTAVTAFSESLYGEDSDERRERFETAFNRFGRIRLGVSGG